MTKGVQTMSQTDAADIRETARRAVVESENIHDAVRDLVVRALSRESLTQDHIRAVATVVLEGVAAGALEGSAETAQGLREAAEGLDEAIARAAQASHLAIEEAAGRTDDFTEQDLQKAIGDLHALETLFQDLVISFAKSSSRATRGIVEDLARHFERVGTDTARAVRRATHSGLGAASAAHLPDLEDVGRATRGGLSTIAAIGSGILSGLAEGLAPGQGKPPPTSPTEPEDS
ncbi:DUF6781 family protein [Roseovarius autotrophicus]|uniref:DUF6781 family protein n=1 Tax=Roseovarius autotrophicus TaxID=2824121 RepID=UPI001B37F7AA|nr:DUF6781 family protein [Roseovarius autotrophicus]